MFHLPVWDLIFCTEHKQRRKGDGSTHLILSWNKQPLYHWAQKPVPPSKILIEAESLFFVHKGWDHHLRLLTKRVKTHNVWLLSSVMSVSGISFLPGIRSTDAFVVRWAGSYGAVWNPTWLHSQRQSAISCKYKKHTTRKYRGVMPETETPPGTDSTEGKYEFNGIRMS